MKQIKPISLPKIQLTKCDNCNRPAVWNLQNWWHLYSIDKHGAYTETKDWEGDSNEHYCQKHAVAENIISTHD